MFEKHPDAPDVIIFPPLVLIGTIVIGFALQWLMPLGFLASFGQTSRIVLGVFAIVAGVLSASVGRRALTSRGTNVNPLRPTTALATDGIYSWTRNPLYVGGMLVMIGLTLIFALDWLLLLTVPSALILHFGIIKREEQYLERKFGDDYRQYKARVPRYLGPL